MWTQTAEHPEPEQVSDVQTSASLHSELEEQTLLHEPLQQRPPGQELPLVKPPKASQSGSLPWQDAPGQIPSQGPQGPQ